MQEVRRHTIRVCSLLSRPHLRAALALVSVLVSPSMFQGLVSRTARCNSIYKVLTSLRHGHALGHRPVLLASGGHAPLPITLPSVRHYAKIPPGRGQGGFPEFKFPMQQQYAKGDALKEFVRATLRFWVPLVLDAAYCSFRAPT